MADISTPEQVDASKKDPCCGKGGGAYVVLITMVVTMLLTAWLMAEVQKTTIKTYIDISKQAREACADQKAIDVVPIIKPKPNPHGLGFGVQPEADGG